MQNIELIAARPDDLDEIHALCRDVARRTPSSQWSDEYPSREILCADLERGTLYKVLKDGKIVSIMQIRSWADFMNGEEADDISGWSRDIQNPCALGRFCVSPDVQHQGLGRRVMTASLEKAAAMGYDAALFHMVKGNHIAQALYESMGFRCAGEIHEYGMDFLCYEMKLTPKA